MIALFGALAIVSFIATIAFLILYLVAPFKKNKVNRKKFRNYFLIAFILIFACAGLMDHFSESDTSSSCSSQVKYKWNAKSVIQKMNQIAIIDHPQKWQSEIEKFNYGKNIHSLKTLNKVLKVGNKHAYAASSMKEFEHVDYPSLSTYNKLRIINVPGFYSLNQKFKKKYVQILRTGVSKVPKKQPIILNFSNNSGGDATAMIAGLASLIPNGKLWLETSKSGKTSQLVLTPHELKKNNHTVVKIKQHHFIDRRVLLITNEYTASAAEFTIIALKRNHNVKSYGWLYH